MLTCHSLVALLIPVVFAASNATGTEDSLGVASGGQQPTGAGPLGTEAPAEPHVAAATESGSDALADAEQQAELELAKHALRLGLTKAWARVVQGRYDEGARLAATGRNAAERLPESAERDALIADFDKVLQEARTHTPAGASGAGAATASGEVTRPAPIDPVSPASPRPLVRAFEGGRPVGTPEFPYTDPAELDARFEAYLERVLARLGEDRDIRSRVMTYPPNWPQITQRRAPFKDGTIWQGPPFQTPEGEWKQTIIYDVQSLLMGPVESVGAPHFSQFVLSPLWSGGVVIPYWWGTRLPTARAIDPFTGLPMLTFQSPALVPGTPPAVPTNQERLEELQRLVEQALGAK
ncbi:MAG TPA: hypothetical protein PKK06_18230 [Phycisphaerae bacterium]|nr:hypothetical protein [Phycisphaerae bacterium]HNU47150.1 hypothetical protein [Phycisphaerae bacterium]